jgi:hypothetical protein
MNLRELLQNRAPRGTAYLSDEKRAGIKNLLVDHDFKKVAGSGYDPKQDGPDPKWGRIDVYCPVCGEERRVGVTISELNRMVGGCIRDWNGKTFALGDQLAAPCPAGTMFGNQVVTFRRYMKDGRLWVSSNGNLGEYAVNPEDVEPLLGE